MSDLHKRLGERIRYKRLQKDYSQRQLGDRVGYTQKAISKFENGTRKVDAIALFALAGELGCSTEELNPFC